MLNEDKIRLMTKAASFEAGEGKEALSMNRYFRSDYISLQLIFAWISYTVSFALCMGLWGFYNMEYLLTNLHKMDLPALGKRFAFLYLGLLGVFLLIHYVIYHLRYKKNKRNLAVYHQILKRIAHIYQMESKNGSSDFTSGGTKKDDNATGI